jgi:prepilin-type N-terminal cleavage/methylation domain-containing protein
MILVKTRDSTLQHPPFLDAYSLASKLIGPPGRVASGRSADERRFSLFEFAEHFPIGLFLLNPDTSLMLVRYRRYHRGFTLIELLVTIAIIGVLVAVSIPAVQSAREAARSTDCKNRIRQLALATHMHHDALGYFPPARYEARPDDEPANQCGLETPTWLARVMPYIEQSALGEQWDLSVTWYEHPEAVRTFVPDIFLCPSRRAGTRPLGTRELRAVTDGGGGRLPCGCPIPPRPVDITLNVEGALCDYAGNHGDLTPGATGEPTDFYYGGNGTGVIISVRPQCKDGTAIAPIDRIRMVSVSDGTSSTFLFGEKFVPIDRLAQFPEDSPAYDGDHLPASCRLAGPGLRLANSPRDVLADMFSFGSWHPAGVHFALVDGSVSLYTPDIDTKVLGSLANRRDARVVELAN